MQIAYCMKLASIRMLRSQWSVPYGLTLRLTFNFVITIHDFQIGFLVTKRNLAQAVTSQADRKCAKQYVRYVTV